MTIVFITQAEGLHSYAVHKLYRALMEDTSQLGKQLYCVGHVSYVGLGAGLVNVGVWCLGEYGELLTSPCVYEEYRYESAANTNRIRRCHACAFLRSESCTEGEVVTILERASK
jgi:hypothetical protein